MNLEIFWLRDNLVEDSANCLLDALALEIAEELEAAPEQIATMQEDLKR